MAVPAERSVRGGSNPAATLPVPGGGEQGSARSLAFVVALPLVALAAGRFLPGPKAWGFNHLAYLPGWFFGIWLVAALSLVALLHPGIRKGACDRLAGPIPAFLFGSRLVAWSLAVASGVLFWLLREKSFFMGDGYLVGELVDRGMPFRAFDNLDYLLHYQVYRRLGAGGARFSSFDLYRGCSIVVGVLAVAIWLRLAARLPWPPWRKAALAGLLFFAGPVALFFGYVESYSFLLLFLTAFLLCGLLVLEGRARLWLASTFFGLGLAFHLTALFTAPALLVLAWRAPGRSWSRKALEAFGPPALLFLMAVALHVAEGYNVAWFRREFLEAQNTKSIWIPLQAGRGLLTAYHWKDLANLALITAPVCLLVVLAGGRRLPALLREPRFQFLAVQIGSLAFFAVALDRKLGGARDWDLLAAHAAGIILLAAMLLPGRVAGLLGGAVEPPASAPGGVSGGGAGVSAAAGERARSAPGKGKERPGHSGTAMERPGGVVPFALCVALLVTLPWIVLLHWEDRSIARFVDVAGDFPEFPRGYAYEEVGKYYRKAGDLPRAQGLYEKAVATSPKHSRIRVLLGSIYFAQENIAAAEEQYQTAYQLDPKNYMAIEMLGQVEMRRQQYEAAYGWFQKLIQLQPAKATSWEYYGYAAVRSQHWAEAVEGLRRAMALDPTKQTYLHEVAVALGQMGRFEEAVQALRQRLAGPDVRPESRLLLAWTRLQMAQQAAEQGRPVPGEWLDEADSQLQIAAKERPGDAQIADLVRILRHLRS